MGLKVWPPTDMERRGVPDIEVRFFRGAADDTSAVHVLHRVGLPRVYENLGEDAARGATISGLVRWYACCGVERTDLAVTQRLGISAFPDGRLCLRCLDRWPYQTHLLFEHRQGYDE